MTKKSQDTDNQNEMNDQEVNDTPDQEQVDAAEDTSPEEDVEVEKIEEPTIEEKMSELQNKYLRLSAEFDNYRKRTLREKIDLQVLAKEDILSNILPVVDDFERGMDSVEKATDIKSVKEGIKLIYTKFSGFLKQQGVKEIEAVGKKFDTDLHEAITKIPVESKKKKGKVVDVVEKGYTLKDKVIRYAKVVIGE
jgi:molecular chaperone GrpE